MTRQANSHCDSGPVASAKGLRPLPPTPAGFRISDFWIFWKMLSFGFFPVGFGVWEGLQSIGNGCGLQMDRFSAHFEPHGSTFEDFHDFYDFEIVSNGLTLFPEGPGTLRDRPEGPGTP